MSQVLQELVRRIVLPANFQGKYSEKPDKKVIKHNNEVSNLKIIESVILFLSTLITTPISREIAIRIPEIWTVICIPAILAGFTVVQIIDLVIFYVQFETSQKRIF
mgnify:CR=1 FL=1